MIYSMTAFSRVQSQGDWGNLVCEMRSLIIVILKLAFMYQEPLRILETPIRELIRQHIKRGKIECSIRYQAGSSSGNVLAINTGLVQELCQAAEKVAGFLKNPAPISPSEILRFPGVMESQEADVKKLQEEVFHLLDKVMKDLVTARAREGEELKQTFLQRMDLIQGELAKVRERLPAVMQEQREKLFKRLGDAKLELDAGRLEQEMVIYAHKIDVAEEIDRTETHILEVRRVLKDGGLAGLGVSIFYCRN